MLTVDGSRWRTSTLNYRHGGRLQRFLTGAHVPCAEEHTQPTARRDAQAMPLLQGELTRGLDTSAGLLDLAIGGVVTQLAPDLLPLVGPGRLLAPSASLLGFP